MSFSLDCYHQFIIYCCSSGSYFESRMTTSWPVSGQHPAQVSLTNPEITPEQAHFYGMLWTEQGEQDQADWGPHVSLLHRNQLHRASSMGKIVKETKEKDRKKKSTKPKIMGRRWRVNGDKTNKAFFKKTVSLGKVTHSNNYFFSLNNVLIQSWGMIQS